MAWTKSFLGWTLLQAPRLTVLRRVPLFGSLLHELSYRVVAPNQLLWFRVRAGLGKGLWLKLHPRTGKDYYEGEVEPVVQQALMQWLRQGMVFYDIGANIGFFTLIAASIVGNEGKVFSFEPEPELALRLIEHIDRNRFSNVSVVQAGLWSATGRAMFVPSDPLMSPDRGTGNLAPATSGGNAVSVPCIALDDFVRDSPPPDLIKCDVEGAEVEVFQGAARLLAEHRPVVVCEVHSDVNGRRLGDLFKGCGYELNLLDENHLLALPCK